MKPKLTIDQILQPMPDAATITLTVSGVAGNLMPKLTKLAADATADLQDGKIDLMELFNLIPDIMALLKK